MLVNHLGIVHYFAKNLPQATSKFKLKSNSCLTFISTASVSLYGSFR